MKVKVAGLEEDLKREKEERQEKEAAEQKQNIADQRIASPKKKINIVKRHEESLDALMNEHKETIASSVMKLEKQMPPVTNGESMKWR